MITHYNILVKGKVQGVWFRKYTKHKADDLQLTGIVKNNPDKSVYIEIEGDENKIREFIDWLYKGSPLSKVSLVEFTKGELCDYKAFEIRF